MVGNPLWGDRDTRQLLAKQPINHGLIMARHHGTLDFHGLGEHAILDGEGLT